MVKKIEKNNHVIIATRRAVTDLVRAYFDSETEYISYESLLRVSSFPSEVKSVVHLAGLNEKECKDDPALAKEINVHQTAKILDAAIYKNVETFLYMSTTQVYGAGLCGDINESRIPKPEHPYGNTNFEAEARVRKAYEQGAIRSIILRMSNAFGSPVMPEMPRWNLLVNDIARQAVTKGEIRLRSNGCQYRDFITLSDVTE
ncbi:MAG TPA: SDR family oxidoreductase, partial [Cyclobacteriaceae bacterium]|nr:SDR family oxidoreductase [Cyclobacteriaceae bacterium]